MEGVRAASVAWAHRPTVRTHFTAGDANRFVNLQSTFDYPRARCGQKG
jgi:hypothetical protein